MPTSTWNHVVVDQNGVAWIDETNVKVIEVVRDKLAHDSSPEEMHFQYPHLSIAQIYAALAYYYDHRDAIDRQIDQEHAEVQESRARSGESPGRSKLRAKGILS